ncbi:MAG: hypothetical protein JXB48_24085 [Candidatus Latescibacteria bacterium]|nr:hypothetical protein [Candidatus Latescibacterota bacterium]
MKRNYILYVCAFLLLLISAAGIIFADILPSFSRLKSRGIKIKRYLLPRSNGQSGIAYMPRFIPDPNIDYKILRMKIDPSINYTILNALRPKKPLNIEKHFRKEPDPPSLTPPKLWHKPYNTVTPPKTINKR